MPKSEDLLKLEQALAAFDPKFHLEFTDEEDDGGSAGSEGGEGNAGGTGSIEVEKRFFIETFSLLRLGEKEFGPTNEFDPAKYLAKETRNLQGEISNEGGVKAHPILSKLSKFDGDTPDMSPPDRNPEAQERYENRLQLQMSMKNRLQQNMTPSPGRGM